ncbi:MAG: leucyl aminopeptidase [Bacteriovoracaceae bacterium]|nr:leucyl aminopeptidase [Bacteriovoracaceae bacterium]
MLVLDFNGQKAMNADVKIVSAFQKTKTSKVKGKTSEETVVSVDHWRDQSLKEEFSLLKANKNFKASRDEVITFTGTLGETVKVVGLGEKTKVKAEDLRKTIAKIFKAAKAEKHSSMSFDFTSFDVLGDSAKAAAVIAEAIGMSDYSFDKYLSKKSPANLKEVLLSNFDKKKEANIKKALEATQPIVEAIHVVRDFVNEVPNVLRSTEYAKLIEADVKKNLKGVKIKILNKAQIKAEGMDMFLSVNAGSAFEPRLVHLTYEPTKKTAKTKHIALVGKGLVFDTGGYSLKPGAGMMGMKHDMAGSATMYGAFRAAVMLKAPVKISCLLGITDNAVNSLATMPDSIVKTRSGKTVEILNTDAEGRLVLGDVLDYACDLKPDGIIDAATLTGACLVALGNQVTAALGNDQKFIDSILKAADDCNEYMWQLPIIPEWTQDMKSKIADLKNIGTPMRAGTATAAAFLKEFIKDDIPWCHLDIAGTADGQSHLPYCPPAGGSGLTVRTLVHMLMTTK